MASENSFAPLVSLACHDLRTPLATVSGFAHTLERLDLEEPAARWLELMLAAAGELGDLLDVLALAARIESGRWEPVLAEADTAELARAAAERLGAESATAEGPGGAVSVDRDAVARALYAFGRCALRHGPVDHVRLKAEGPLVSLEPVTAAAAPILLADDLRDLGAAAGRRTIEALGGSVSLHAETLLVGLPN